MVFCPLQSQCAVQGGESAAAAGERLHFNYGAGCSGAVAGDRIINDKGSSNIHIDQVHHRSDNYNAGNTSDIYTI